MATTKTKYRRTKKNVQIPQALLTSRVEGIEKAMLRTDLPKFGPGDTVRVNVRIKEGEKERIQGYEGVVIAMSNAGSNRSFTVRKMSHGVGVERVFMMASPKVAGVDIVQEGKVRRAKLYYLRELEGKAARIARSAEGAAAGASETK